MLLLTTLSIIMFGRVGIKFPVYKGSIAMLIRHVHIMSTFNPIYRLI